MLDQQEKLWTYEAVEPGQQGLPTRVGVTAENIAEYASSAQMTRWLKKCSLMSQLPCLKEKQTTELIPSLSNQDLQKSGMKKCLKRKKMQRRVK